MWHKEKKGEKKKRKTALFTIFGINRHCIQENKRPLINRHSSPFSAQTIIGHIHLKGLFKNRHFSTFTALMMIGRKKKDTSLLKTGTFVYFQHFYMKANDALILRRFKEKMWHKKTRHFSTFSAIIMIGRKNETRLLKTGTFVLFQHFGVYAHIERLIFEASKNSVTICGIKTSLYTRK